jgi:hypothetical protein
MPGGGAAYGRRPREMGAAELTVETILRTTATLTIGLLFGSLALNTDLDSKVRVGAATFGIPMLALFVVHSFACYREIARRWSASD